MFSNAIKITKIFGFNIRIHPSWLIIATLIVWSLSTSYFPNELSQSTQLMNIGLATIAMLGMFVCLVLHELSHALVANFFDLKIGGITLFIFGGVAELEQEPQNAKSEFYIAIAGPIMSLALFGFFGLIAGVFEQASASQEVVVLLKYLSLINLVLAIFNLIPAFPLDGGRVLRALIWRVTDDLVKATRISSRIGTFLGFTLVLLGVLSLFQSQVIAGIWQILIGSFVISASKSSFANLIMKKALKGQSIRSLMTSSLWTADASDTVLSLVENIMLKHNVSYIPILENGKLLGYVDAAMIQTIDRENWPDTKLIDIYIACNENNTSGPEIETSEIFEKMVRTGNRKMLIANGTHLLGVIALADLVSYLAIRQGIGLEDSLNIKSNSL